MFAAISSTSGNNKQNITKNDNKPRLPITAFQGQNSTPLNTRASFWQDPFIKEKVPVIFCSLIACLLISLGMGAIAKTIFEK